MSYREDGWRTYTELFKEAGLSIYRGNRDLVYVPCNNINFLIEAGVVERMSKNSKWYRVTNSHMWNLLVDKIKERKPIKPKKKKYEVTVFRTVHETATVNVMAEDANQAADDAYQFVDQHNLWEATDANGYEEIVTPIESD